MRRMALVFAVVMAVLALPMATTGGTASAESLCGDRIDGTSRDDTLTGDRAGGCYDTIRGFGGDDVIRGLLLSDELYGGKGRDRIAGGGGDDFIDSSDVDGVGNPVRDAVRCGPGFDRVHGDNADVYSDDCERVTEAAIVN